jgi:hypothetical protein
MVQHSLRLMFKARVVTPDHNFYGDHPAEPGIHGAIDRAHATGAKVAFNFVRTELPVYAGGLQGIMVKQAGAGPV